MGTLYVLYLSLSGAEEEVLGRIPRDLDHGFDLSAEVPYMMFLFYTPLVSVEQVEAEVEVEGWRLHISQYYRFFYWRAELYWCATTNPPYLSARHEPCLCLYWRLERYRCAELRKQRCAK